MPVPAGAPDLSRPGRDGFALRHRKAHRQECLCYLDCATRPFPTGSESRTRRVCDRLRDPSCALRMRKRRRVASLDIRHRMNSQTVLH